ncbi:MAG: hypothetical protein RL226_599 [Bacteroidota bacterium]
MKNLLYIAFMLVSTMVCGQDSQFTQFYAAPTYLNPAFAGTSVQHRMSANYRKQWASIPGGWVAYNAAFDTYVAPLRSGIGFLATHEKAGTGGLRATTISAQYAYEVTISRGLFFRPALQFSFSNRNINFNDLTFGDQLLRNNDPTTLEANVFQPINFFDLATGAVIANANFWFGASVHHLNQPNESLFPDRVGVLPRKYSAHGGYKFHFNGRNRDSNNLIAAFNYKKQGEFDQLDLGAYYEVKPVTFGLWYRGLPLKSNGYGYLNHDSFALIVGFDNGAVKFGYSYDFTISQLSIASSGGSHELSYVYEWGNRKNLRASRKRIVPCAKF